MHSRCCRISPKAARAFWPSLLVFRVSSWQVSGAVRHSRCVIFLHKRQKFYTLGRSRYISYLKINGDFSAIAMFSCFREGYVEKKHPGNPNPSLILGPPRSLRPDVPGHNYRSFERWRSVGKISLDMFSQKYPGSHEKESGKSFLIETVKCHGLSGDFFGSYSFSHNHRSGKWSYLRGNSYWRDPFLTSMIMGRRVILKNKKENNRQLHIWWVFWVGGMGEATWRHPQWKPFFLGLWCTIFEKKSRRIES